MIRVSEEILQRDSVVQLLMIMNVIDFNDQVTGSINVKADPRLTKFLVLKLE